MNNLPEANSFIGLLKSNKNLRVYSSALLFSLIVGFSFLGVKACLQLATPLEVLTHRFNVAFIAALIPLVLRFTKVELKDKPKKQIFITMIFYVAFMALQALGLQFSTSIESGILFAVIPVFAKIIARFLIHEATNWKQNLFMTLSIVAVISMFILGATSVTINPIGILFLLISSICMAFSNVMMRYVRGSFRPYEIAFATAAGGCILFNIATLVWGLKTGSLEGYFAPLFHLEFFIAITYLAVLSTFLSNLIMSYMLANMEAMKATLFGNLSTAISILAGAVFLSEPLLYYHIICTALIIISVIGVSLPSMQSKA